MNTPSNAGKEPGKNLEYRKCLSCDEHWDVTHESTNICPACGSKANVYMSEFIPDRIRTTPPMQSQEGETEVDTAHKQFHAQDEYAHHPGVSLEFVRTLHSRLTASQRENDRLRSEVAVLDEIMKGERIVTPVNKEHATWMYRTAFDYLNAARAATEEGKRG